MALPKVLVDLRFAHTKMGYSGIPQDSRLLFDGLAQSRLVDAEGLISSLGTSWRGREIKSLEDQTAFLGSYLASGHQRGHLVRLLHRISPTLAMAFERLVLTARIDHRLYRLQSDTLQDMVWRVMLINTIDPARRQALLQREYFLTALGLLRITDGAAGRLPKARLDTRGHEFIIFQDSRGVVVSPGTTKIIRYHDGIPVFSSDTLAVTSEHGRQHIRAIKSCEKDSIFVCNSPSSQNDLERISPRAAEKSRVIPYFVPRMNPVAGQKVDLARLALPRVSEATLGKSSPSDIVARWFARTGGAVTVPDYVMTLSTIEPRKNIRSLILAWQKHLNTTGKTTKLLIIGAPGWEYDRILKDMQPFVATGQLLHLQGVSQDELRYWYGAARCFAFVSVAEGFGIPPIEAMQCDCPVLVSDIAAHRYSAGDAAEYCDPYDTDDIAAKIDFLLAPESRTAVSAAILRGRANADRFTVKNVLPLWEDLFARPPTLAT
jgi:glycosyltransferase involved in cell wall biosynthesis